MKKTLLFTSMVAMLFAFGCSKEMDNPNAETIPGRGTKVTIGASLEFPEGVSTKSTLNSTTGAFAWTQNSSERIWVQTYGGSFEYLKWDSEGTDPANARFTGWTSYGIVPEGYGVFPVYYANDGITPLNRPSVVGSNLTITLPSEIAWVSGEANNVMVGNLIGTQNLNFYNVGGMFMVTIGNMPSEARKITFTTGKRISGDFAVTTDPDDGNHYIINTDETNTNGVTFTFTSEQIANEMVFYVPAPIGEYAGLAFQVKDANNNVLASFNGSTSKTITRKKLIILPKLNFASVGGNGENGTGNLVIPANYTTEKNHGVFLLPSTTSDLEVLIYENSNVTIRYSEGDKPANVALIAQNAIETLNIELPESHVTLNGANTSSNVTINNVEATTSTSTFVVGAGIQIGSGQENQGLTIKGGSLTLGAPVDGTVKVNIPATNTNTTDEKVNIVINSAIYNLEVNTAATQDAPDKVWVSINAGASVTDAIAVPEVNCNLYIAAGASAATVNTKAEETTIEGTVGAIIASKSTQEGAEAPTVTVTSTATVSTSISATGGANVFVDSGATGAGTVTANQTKDDQSSINETSGEIVAVIGTHNYATLTAAFAAAQNGQTVKLMKDYDATGETMYDSYRNLGIDKGIIFDGAGHILVVKGRGIAVGAAAEGNIDVTFKDITIKNSTNAARCVDTRGHIGTLTLDNAKLDTQGASGAYTQPLTIGGNQAAIANIIIKNGSVIQTNDDATAYYAIITFNPVNMSITGSTITGWAAIYMKGKVSSEGSHGSTVNIVNSTINARNVYAGYTNAFAAFALEDSDIAINITNSTLNVHGDSNYQAIVSFDNGDANCNNQTVNLGEGNTVNLTGEGLFRFSGGNATCSLNITGGTFTKDPSAYCAAGYEATQSGNVWTVAPISGVAAIGTKGYETLAAAFAAVNNNETITMLADVNLTDRIFVNAGATPTLDSGNRYATSTESKTITLDLNGHNITSTSNFAQAGGTFNITNTGTADDTHGVISTTTAGLAPVEVRGTGDLTAKRTLNVGAGVTLTGTTYGINVFGSNTDALNKIEVNVNGTVNGTIFVLGNLKNTDNEISINVNGKVYVAANDDDKRTVGVALNGYASVNVASTANVEGETGIEVRAGQLTVANGATIKANSSFSYEANGSGSTTAGAAIAVVQHTTGLPITATINGGTLTGVKKLYVKDEMRNYLDNVAVSAVEAIKNEAEIPAGFVWQANGNKFDLVRFFAAQIGETKYATLAEAIAAAESGDTIVILSDFTVEGNAGVTIPAGKNITIDLNGKTIKNLVNADANSQLIVNRGTLTITDSSAGANGTMTNEIASGVHTGAWTNYNYYTNIISNFGTLTINAGNLTQVATTNISYVIDNLGANSSVTINGGSLMAGYIPIRAYNATNSVTIHGGSLSGLFDLYLQLTTTLVIDGGTFSAPTRSIIYVDAASNISISGNPVFTNGTDRKFIAFDTDAVKDASTLSVTGGTYNTDPSAYVAAGYEAVQSGNNWNVQVKATPEMWINHAASSYESVDETNKIITISTAAQLAKLAKDIQDNDANPSTFEYMGWMFKLTSDIDLSGKIWTPIGADLTNYYQASFRGTFDGNHHKITNMHAVANGWAGLFGPIHSGMEVIIKDLTIEDFVVESNHYAGAIVGWIEQASQAVTISGCVVNQGTITSTPELTNTGYDNGDKVGGICGYIYKATSAASEARIVGNTVSNVDITAYRDLGGLLGYAANVTTISGNTVSCVNIYQNNTNAYKDSVTTYGPIIGRNVNSVTSGNTTENVNIYTGTPGSYNIVE